MQAQTRLDKERIKLSCRDFPVVAEAENLLEVANECGVVWTSSC